MIELKDLQVEQGAFQLKANFKISSGRIVAVLGPSGSGKSTLLAAIGGYLPVKAGHVIVNGQSATELDPAQRDIATLFQSGNLFEHLSLAQNVGLGLRPSLKLNATERDEVNQALSTVGLSDHLDKRPGEVSGGQLSRAALARALIQKKSVLLLDEPFAALGPALRVQMLELTTQTARAAHKTVLLVTHNPEDAKRIADDVLLVSGGQTHGPWPQNEAFTAPMPALAQYLGTEPNA